MPGELQPVLSPGVDRLVADDVVAASLHPGQHQRGHQLAGQCCLCHSHRLEFADDQPAAAEYCSAQPPEP